MSVCHSWCDIISSDDWKEQCSTLLHQRRIASPDAGGKRVTEIYHACLWKAIHCTIFM